MLERRVQVDIYLTLLTRYPEWKERRPPYCADHRPGPASGPGVCVGCVSLSRLLRAAMEAASWYLPSYLALKYSTYLTHTDPTIRGGNSGTHLGLSAGHPTLDITRTSDGATGPVRYSRQNPSARSSPTFARCSAPYYLRTGKRLYYAPTRMPTPVRLAPSQYHVSA
jgi:hypothetical protein